MKRPSHRESINLMLKHYPSLFYLPSIRILLTASLLVRLPLGFLISLLAYPLANFSALSIWDILLKGIWAWFILSASILFSDYLISKLLLKEDLIFSSFNRVTFISLLSDTFFIVFAAIGLLLKCLHVEIYLRILFLGFYAALTFRLLVIDTISFAKKHIRVMLSVFQPTLFLLLSTLLVSLFEQRILNPYTTLYYSLSALIFSIIGVWLFKRSLDVEGEKLFGIPSLKVAKAFAANWAEDIREPLEEILEQLGEERIVSISTLAFRDKSTKRPKAIIVVPNIHPGPFKNIGSSLLPSMIKEALEKEFQCTVSVPHGISGHELDLSSQAENEKVIKSLIASLKELKDFSSRVTSFFMVEERGAKAGCQIFDNCAFITLTTSPESMEDLPPELNDAIVKKALEKGFSWAIVVDTHNCTDESSDVQRAIRFLEEAAYLALEKASLLKNAALNEMRVGAGSVHPEGLGLKEGMGPGGITAIIVETNGEKTAYVTIDGNNMASGLREEILSSLKELGIEHGEVFTTDTHAVSAIVLNKRGYHPIGEAIDHKIIIEEVKKAICVALENMAPAEVSWSRVDIPKIKVIGERRISELSLLTDNVIRKAKKNFIIFAILGALYMAVLLTI